MERLEAITLRLELELNPKLDLAIAVASTPPFGPKRGSVLPACCDFGVFGWALSVCPGPSLRFRLAVRPTGNPLSDAMAGATPARRMRT